MEKQKQKTPIQVYYHSKDKPKRKGKDEAMWLSDIAFDNADKIPPDERAYREAKMKSFYEYRHAMNNKPIPEKYRNEPPPNGMQPIENNQRAQMELEQDID